jgi:rubrerythrin
MKLDEAITIALKHEAGVHKAYQEAMDKTDDEVGKRIFRVLRDEEMGHLKYLQERLDEWRATGKIVVKSLGTSIPTKVAIYRSLRDVRKTVEPKSTQHNLELELLKKALIAEIKTSDFYKEMVSTLDGQGKELFARFVEIEEGHEAIVQAEIDSVSNAGFWMGMPEFDLEVG